MGKAFKQFRNRLLQISDPKPHPKLIHQLFKSGVTIAQINKQIKERDERSTEHTDNVERG